jgi:hypothetical protein
MSLESICCDAVGVAARDAEGADVGKSTENSSLESQIVEKLFDFCGTRKFTAVFTGASQCPRLGIGKRNVTHNILVYKSQQVAHVSEIILSENCTTRFGCHYNPSSGEQNNCNYSI